MPALTLIRSNGRIDRIDSDTPNTTVHVIDIGNDTPQDDQVTLPDHLGGHRGGFTTETAEHTPGETTLPLMVANYGDSNYVSHGSVLLGRFYHETVSTEALFNILECTHPGTPVDYVDAWETIRDFWARQHPGDPDGDDIEAEYELVTMLLAFNPTAFSNLTDRK